ncbi:Serine/threonine kinase [Gonapodya sp. JEL0774]|nr:Serine/threonine kinase [Gonapodya sp. JEL0774]
MADEKLADLDRKIAKEKHVLVGAQTMRPHIADASLVAQCDQTIRDAQARIDYLELEKDRLLRRNRRGPSAGPDVDSYGVPLNGTGADQRRRGPAVGGGAVYVPSAGGNVGGISFGQGGSAVGGPRAPLPELRFAGVGDGSNVVSEFDYWKPATPLSHLKIRHRRHLIDLKLSVETKVKSGTERLRETLSKLTTADSKKMMEETVDKLKQSGRKVELLRKARARYDAVWVDTSGEDDEDPPPPAPGTRRIMTGKLHLTVHSLHSVPGRASSSTPLFITVRLDNAHRASTTPNRAGSWTGEQLVMDVDRDGEVEIAVCEMMEGGGVQVLSMVWFKLSEVEDEARRVALAGGAGQPDVPEANSAVLSERGLAPEEAAANMAARSGSVNRGMVDEDKRGGGFACWLEMEPAGQALVELSFVSDPTRRRARNPDGALSRLPGVRKQFHRKGHRFEPRQYYQVMKCALCGEFLVTGQGYGCVGESYGDDYLSMIDAQWLHYFVPISR